MSSAVSSPLESMSCIIELELLREREYEKILYWLLRRLYSLHFKDVSNILLRYIFNKIITRREEEDPVFVETPSPVASMQLEKDVKYFNISIEASRLNHELELKIARSAHKIREWMEKKRNFPFPERVILQENILKYKNKIFKDVKSLVQKYPREKEKIFCIYLRYNYLNIGTHALSADFYQKYEKNYGHECFSSPFNNYFDSYYSAFPDLEASLGSKGSFWKKFPSDTYTHIFINPPFDEGMILEIWKLIKEKFSFSSSLEITLTIPLWNDMSIFTEVKSYPYFRELNTYKKGELPFTDNLKNKTIYPCVIAVINFKKA